MLAFYFTFTGLNELLSDFAATEAKLAAGFQEPLRLTRDAIRQGIRELFASQGQATNRGAAPQHWRFMANTTRTKRLNREKESWKTTAYYDEAPGPVQDTLGIWTGEMFEALTSDRAPGFSTITNDQLEMGIRMAGNATVKWHSFIEGRSNAPPQEPRAIFENIAVEEILRDVFGRWAVEELPILREAGAEAMQGAFI